MSNVPLCKIGTGWVFDVNTGIGYRIQREQKTGVIQAFETAFAITNGNVTYKLEVPSGIVRKALHLLELQKAGKLEKIVQQIEGEKR